MKLRYIVTILLASIIGFYACESMDDNFKQYLGEYNYSGRIDSLRVYPGYERVVLAWDNPIDQKSQKIKVVYGPDSTEVIYDTLVDSVSIDGLQAGTGYEFTVYTLDAKGNISVPTSVTAFPISQSFVETLTAPSLVVETQGQDQVITLLGLSNVMMRFSGVINYSVTGPGGFTADGEIDVTDQVIKTNPTTGAIEHVTLNELTMPIADLGLGINLLPPGPYTFTYTASVWPIMDNLTSIDEIELERVINMEVQPIIINVTVLGGQTSDQYNTTGGEGVDKVTDGNHNSKYLTGNRQTWIKFITNNPQIVKRYTLVSGNDAPERDPKDWNLEASTDGENWVILDERRNMAFGGRNAESRFDVNNDTMYQYYRLNILNNNGGNLFQLSEWTLYGLKLE